MRFILLFVSSILFSCVSTKHMLGDGSRIVLEVQSTVVFVPPIGQESVYKNVYDIIQKEAKSECLNIHYLPEIEYELAVHGVDHKGVQEGSKAALSSVDKWRDDVYVVYFENLENFKSGGVLASPYYYKQPVRRATWQTVIKTKEPAVYWSYKTRVVSNYIQTRRNGGITVRTAYYIGLKKAIKHLRQESYPSCN